MIEGLEKFGTQFQSKIVIGSELDVAYILVNTFDKQILLRLELNKSFSSSDTCQSIQFVATVMPLRSLGS